MNYSVSIKLIGILFWEYLVPFIRNEFESWIIPIPFFYPHPYDLSGNNRIEIIKPILEGGAEIFMMWEQEVHDRSYRSYIYFLYHEQPPYDFPTW